MQILLVDRKCALPEDFNGHAGNDSDRYNGVQVSFEYGLKNDVGEKRFNFVHSFELKITNTCFHEDVKKLVTSKFD